MGQKQSSDTAKKFADDKEHKSCDAQKTQSSTRLKTQDAGLGDSHKTQSCDAQKTQSSTRLGTQDAVIDWNINHSLSQLENISPKIADNIIKLFEDEATIPFIARYRGDLTGGLTPDQLRKIKSTYECLLKVRAKANDLIKKISKKQPISASLKSNIQSARTLEELEFIEAPFKTDSKRSLAEKAKELGLEKPANHIIHGDVFVSLEDYVDITQLSLYRVNDVRIGIQYIIASYINKIPKVLESLDKMLESKY